MGRKPLTTAVFVERAKKIFGDLYDYSKTRYVGAHDNLIITCEEHGDFTVIADSHSRKKQGCPGCLTLGGNFIGQPFGRLTVLEKTDERSNGEIVWKCQCSCPDKTIIYRHTNLLTSGDVKSCGCLRHEIPVNKYTKEDFVLTAAISHNSKYRYSDAIYVDYNTPLEITCLTHGNFKRTPNSHLAGKGCQECIKERRAKRIIRRAEKLIGEKKNLLTVTGVLPSKPDIGVMLKCLCDCGNTAKVSKSCFTTGTTKSCGCFKDAEFTRCRLPKDVTGVKSGYLTAIRKVGKNKSRSNMWLCECSGTHSSCKGSVEISATDISAGNVKSCGCLKSESVSETAYKHGCGDHPLRGKWRDMHNKCYNESSSSYSSNGLVGIGVHEQWHNFENYVEDTWPIPEDSTLCRLDITKNFGPDNFEWRQVEREKEMIFKPKTTPHNVFRRFKANYKRLVNLGKVFINDMRDTPDLIEEFDEMKEIVDHFDAFSNWYLPFPRSTWFNLCTSEDESHLVAKSVTFCDNRKLQVTSLLPFKLATGGPEGAVIDGIFQIIPKDGFSLQAVREHGDILGCYSVLTDENSLKGYVVVTYFGELSVIDYDTRKILRDPCDEAMLTRDGLDTSFAQFQEVVLRAFCYFSRFMTDTKLFVIQVNQVTKDKKGIVIRDKGRVTTRPSSGLYRIVDLRTIRKRYVRNTSETSDRTIRGGPRRRHERTYRDDRFVNMKGKTIIIDATWVGPTEEFDPDGPDGGYLYKVRLDIG